MTKPKDVVKQIRKATRRKFSAEEKIRIVLEGLRGQIAVSDLCRRENVVTTVGPQNLSIKFNFERNLAIVAWAKGTVDERDL